MSAGVNGSQSYHGTRGSSPPEVPTVPISYREEGLDARRAALLGDTDDIDEKTGLPRLFPKWKTFPWHLRKHSSFLALHFGTIGLLGLFLFIYSLLSIYPLASCVQANNFQKTYSVYTGKDVNGVLMKDNFLAEQCRKSIKYDVRFPEPLENAFLLSFCRDQKFYAGGTCKASTEPCCRFNFNNHDFDTKDSEEIPVAHVWVWCVIGMLSFVGWIIVLQYFQYQLAEAGNTLNVNVSQYAVLVSNLGGAACNNQLLIEYGRQWGEVVSAFFIPDFGRYLYKNIQRDNLRKLYRELLMMQHPETNPYLYKFPWNMLFSVYKRMLCIFKSLHSKIDYCEHQEDKLGNEIISLSKEPDQSTGNGIIIFNEAANAADMLYDHNLCNMVANYIIPPEVGRAWHIMTRGRLAKTPKIELETQDSHGSNRFSRHVSVTRAPGPSDLMWENTLFGGKPIIRRRILTWIGYVVLLGIALVVQVYLTRAAAEENEKRQQTVESDGWVALGSKYWWTIIKSLVTVSMSNMSIGLIHIFSDYNLFLSHTHNVGSTISKIAVFVILTQFAVPVLAYSPISSFLGELGDKESGVGTDESPLSLWYTDGGLVELACTIQIFNALFSSLFFLFRIDDMMNYHIFSRLAMGKDYAVMYLYPPAFRMNLRMAQAIGIFGMAMLYAPILPVSPFIGFLGLALQYVVDQYIALRHSSKPRAFQVNALTGSNYVLRAIPLAQALLCGFLYFNFDEGQGRQWPPVAIGVVIWAVACIAPLMYRIRQAHYKQWVEGRTGGIGGRPKFLDWAIQPGDHVNNNMNEAGPSPMKSIAESVRFHTSSLVPDIPANSDVFRFNYDSYMPDFPTLEGSVFMNTIQPRFKYHNPPFPKLTQNLVPGATTRIARTGRYESRAPTRHAMSSLLPQAPANTYRPPLASVREGNNSFVPPPSFDVMDTHPANESLRSFGSGRNSMRNPFSSFRK